jgi:hypothetical protein
MKKLAILAVLLLMLIPLFLGSSCAGVQGFQDDFLKIVPSDTNNYLVVIDLTSLRNDKDLSDIYQQINNGNDPSSEFGLDYADIDYMGAASGGSDSLVLLRGAIDKKAIESKFDDLGYSYEIYNNYKLWTDNNGYYTMAFVPAGFIMGDSVDGVKNSIRTMTGSVKSLYADQNVKAVSNKTGAGFIVLMGFSSDLTSQYDGATGFGVSVSKLNKSNLTIQGLYQFTDTTQAKSALSSVKDDLGNSQWTTSKVSQSGSALLFEGTWNISNFDFSSITP